MNKESVRKEGSKGKQQRKTNKDKVKIYTKEVKIHEDVLTPNMVHVVESQSMQWPAVHTWSVCKD